MASLSTKHRPGPGCILAEVRARINSVTDFTPAESRVAEFYLSSLPGAAFLNLAQTSQASGVSTATVTRFAKRLGFDDFRALSNWLMEGARRELEKPKDRRISASIADHPLSHTFTRAESDLRTSLASLNAVSFERTVDLVTDGSRPLYLAAVASGQPLMEHFALLLGYLRGNIQVLDGVDRWPHQLAGLDEHSVVLAATYDRDPLPVIGLLQMTGEVGATSIIITNQHRSPLVRMADVNLTTTTERGSMFGSRIATLCVLEGILDAVSRAIDGVENRAEVIERMFSTLSIHPQGHH